MPLISFPLFEASRLSPPAILAYFYHPWWEHGARKIVIQHAASIYAIYRRECSRRRSIWNRGSLSAPKQKGAATGGFSGMCSGYSNRGCRWIKLVSHRTWSVALPILDCRHFYRCIVRANVRVLYHHLFASVRFCFASLPVSISSAMAPKCLR